jgi:DNA-binding CsgD family transcriptional regulator
MITLSKLKKIVPHKILNSLQEEIFDLIYLLDVMEDKYQYISATEKLLGHKKNIFYKKGSDFTLSLINPNDYQRVILHFATILKNSTIQDRIISKDIQFRMRHLNGNWIWISRTAVTYKEGKTYKVLGLVKDCSNKEDKEKTLIGKIEKGNKTLKTLGESLNLILKENYKLTKREIEVLKLVCEGLSSKMIAHKLNISGNTVAVYRKNLHRKFEVHNSASLIKKAAGNVD